MSVSEIKALLHEKLQIMEAISDDVLEDLNAGLFFYEMQESGPDYLSEVLPNAPGTADAVEKWVG